MAGGPHGFLLRSSATLQQTHAQPRHVGRASLRGVMYSPGTADIHSHSSDFFPPPPLEPFTQWKRLINQNTSGVISAETRSTGLDIKQTRDY